MTALTENTPRRYHAVGDADNRGMYTVATGATVYQGSALVRDAAGLVSPSGGSAGLFAGFSREYGEEGMDVLVDVEGFIHLNVAGADALAVDAPVYITNDDNTFTATQGSNTPMGVLYAQTDGTDNWIVKFKGEGL